ncbi:hypothetical protein BKA62DRAFT_834066 [Auriculariales sp. MPI-PUGE-AT-0066]|nr:hypothetical protein BKA62DRAFT_834066 [Auriculariales sp. MPI-PUGE-AT-0066]
MAQTRQHLRSGPVAAWSPKGAFVVDEVNAAVDQIMIVRPSAIVRIDVQLSGDGQVAALQSARSVIIGAPYLRSAHLHSAAVLLASWSPPMSGWSMLTQLSLSSVGAVTACRVISLTPAVERIALFHIQYLEPSAPLFQGLDMKLPRIKSMASYCGGSLVETLVTANISSLRSLRVDIKDGLILSALEAHSTNQIRNLRVDTRDITEMEPAIAILRACPRVRYLQIGNAGSDLLRRMLDAAHRPLVSLVVLHSMTCNKGTALKEFLAQLDPVHPALRYLKVLGVPHEELDLDVDDQLSQACSSLRIRQVRIKHGDDVAALCGFKL